MTEALSLLYRKAKETDPAAMEFLTVDSPQDCVHLLMSMEKDGSEDLAVARGLLESLKGGCSTGPASQISMHTVMYIPASSPVHGISCREPQAPPVQHALGGSRQIRLDPFPGKTGPVRGPVW